MRALVAGAIVAIACSGAVLATVAGATPFSARGGPYEIYILDDAERPTAHIYAIALGQRDAAAEVENCAGRLLADPHRIVAELRARLGREDDDDFFTVVTVDGPGSRVNLGRCNDIDEDDDPESEHGDTLVIVRDASATQARRVVNQIQGLSREDRAAMLETLELSRR